MCSNDNSDTNQYEEKLFHRSLEIYSDDDRKQYTEHYFELYKLYVNTTEAIAERRQKSNSFFLTLNTTIIAIVSYVQLDAKSGESREYWLISLSGMILSYTWHRLIKSYRDINTGKFKIIHSIEKKLPLALYDAEWEVLGRGQKPEVYLEFTTIEKIVPWIFFGIHMGVFIKVFPWNLIYSFFL